MDELGTLGFLDRLLAKVDDAHPTKLRVSVIYGSDRAIPNQYWAPTLGRYLDVPDLYRDTVKIEDVQLLLRKHGLYWKKNQQEGGTRYLWTIAKQPAEIETPAAVLPGRAMVAGEGWEKNRERERRLAGWLAQDINGGKSD